MINEEEVLAANLPLRSVKELLLKLESAGRLADKLGVTIFGGSGTGSLRTRDSGERSLILGFIQHGSWDGGDGHCYPDSAGLMRGE